MLGIQEFEREQRDGKERELHSNGQEISIKTDATRPCAQELAYLLEALIIRDTVDENRSGTSE